MNTFTEDLKAAVDYHGHLCAGQILGVRMAHLALGALGIIEPRSYRDLIVYVEMDRCIADAVGVVTGCTPGRRRLKIVDYGKMGATFVDLAANRAVRVVSIGRFRPPEEGGDPLPFWEGIADKDLFKVQQVCVDVPLADRPGKPSHRATCDTCGEQVLDWREVTMGGQTLCRACAREPYYQILGD